MKQILLDEKYLKTILEYESLYLKDGMVCMKSNREDIIKSLRSKCSTGFIDSDGKLVGYSLIYENEYGVAFFDKCFVLPEYRGKGLQREMILKNIHCTTFHDTITVFTMCAPINFVSLSNLEGTGFKRVGDVNVETIEGERHRRIILERRLR